MPRSSNQKLKLIYLMKILLERTDDTHSITMPEIIDALASYGVNAERKSVYSDIVTIIWVRYNRHTGREDIPLSYRKQAV